jgi:hypothetical protein
VTAGVLLAGVGVAADPGAGELVVEFADERIKLGGVAAVVLGVVAELLGVGALFQQPGLPVIGRCGLDDGFVFEVPAFPALRCPQAPGPFRAGRAHRGKGRAAGHEDLLDVAGVEVGAAQLDGPDAPAVGLGRSLIAEVASGRVRRSARVVRAVMRRHRPSRPARSRTSRTGRSPA